VSLLVHRRGSLFAPSGTSFIAPTFVESTSGSGSSSTVTASAPTGVASGHYQLIAVGIASGTPTFGTTPADWTKLFDVTISYSDGASTGRFGLFESTVDTASFSISQVGTARHWRTARAAWSGHGGRTITPVQVNTGVTANPATPAITTSDSNSLVIGVGVAEEPDGGVGWGFNGTGSFTSRRNATATNGTESLAVVIGDLLVASPTANVTTNFSLPNASESQMSSVVLNGTPA
jgi:hypothetical protein